MIVVTNKKGCLYRGCSCKQPCFNVKGEKKGIYCAKHKLEGMVDVKSKHCAELGCKIRPTYNFEGNKPPLYCSTHGKAKGMVNVMHKRCAEKGCTKHPSCNINGSSTPLYCSAHKN